MNFLKKNIGKIAGSVIGLPIAGAGVAEIAQAPDFDPLTMAIGGLILAIMNVVRIWRKENEV